MGTMSKQQGNKLAGTLVEFQDGFLNLSSEDAQWAIQNGKDAVSLIVKAITERPKNNSEIINSSITRLIESGVMIEKCDGKAFIGKADKIFKSNIDNDFENFGLNKVGNATKKTLLDIHEIVEDAKFSQIFPSINSDLDKLVMTQSQIIRFCEKNPALLRQGGYGTFFLIKENNEYFVVYVSVGSGGLRVSVHRFGHDGVWYGAYRHRVVFPQLVPQVA
jgi:hypothetical protein